MFVFTVWSPRLPNCIRGKEEPLLWFALLVVGGYIVYVLRPDERKRLVAQVAAQVSAATRTVRHRLPRQEADAFHDALAARTRGAYLTAVALLVNGLVFALMLIGPGRMSDPATLARWGGSVGPLTTNGGWWRLITFTFVHPGLVPFIVDVAALLQVAVLVERAFGHVAFAALYVASAVLAGALGLYADPFAVATGGAAPILAMHGVLVAMIVRGTLRRSPLTVPRRLLRRLALPAIAFAVYYMSAGGVAWTSGLATFVIGFGTGLVLTRDAAERTPAPHRLIPFAVATVAMAVAIVAPLKGTVDAREQVAQLFGLEDRIASSYRADAAQFALGRLEANALASRIERSIIPQLATARTRLRALPGVPRQQRPLVAGADEYLRLRIDSWNGRAIALRKSSMRLLRDADRQERDAIAALEQLRPALAGFLPAA